MQFPLAMMKTQHSYLAQSLLLEVERGLLAYLVLLQYLIKGKPLQEEEVEAEAGAGVGHPVT